MTNVARKYAGSSMHMLYPPLSFVKADVLIWFLAVMVFGQENRPFLTSTQTAPFLGHLYSRTWQGLCFFLWGTSQQCIRPVCPFPCKIQCDPRTYAGCFSICQGVRKCAGWVVLLSKEHVSWGWVPGQNTVGNVHTSQQHHQWRQQHSQQPGILSRESPSPSSAIPSSISPGPAPAEAASSQAPADSRGLQCQ